MKRSALILIIAILSMILCCLLVISRKLDTDLNSPTETTSGTESSQQTEVSSEPTNTETNLPTETTVPETSVPETTVPETTVPETTAPPPTETVKPDNGGDYIGTLYTRAELEAMENNRKGYGPGTASGGNRPPYAPNNQNAYGQYGGNFIAPDNGKIYLTFDCGYEYNNLTASILDTLKEKNVKAVFFITMPYAKNHADLVWRMINEGHTVGNHSNTHPDMTTLSIDQMVWEVTSLHDYVKEHFGYEMHLFRPPTGAFSTRTLAVVQSLGYKTVHWSFAYNDWNTGAQPSLEDAYNTITSRHHSGAIYLLHAVSASNTAVLGDVIDFFRAEGYELERFS